MFSSELSDEHVLHLRRKYELTERAPEPLEMSDTEILDYMGSYGAIATWTGDAWDVVLDGGCKGYSLSLRDAICVAAAHDQEANA